MEKRGIFITFEGPDGSGKTTISKGVYQKLIDCGYNALYTREPGGSRIAEEIRNIILNPINTEMDARTEALLYAASRRQHLYEKVIPALSNGTIVICDRFIDSSLAYQGIGRGIGFDEVYSLNQFAIEGHLPDVTIFLDIDAEKGLERIQNRSFKDRLDNEDLSFHEKVFEGYQIVYEHFSDRIIKIDANQSIDEVIEEAYKVIVRKIENV